MIICVEYIGELRYWKYYYYDSGNHKTTVEGFKNHILAEEHAKKTFWGKVFNDIEFMYK